MIVAQLPHSPSPRVAKEQAFAVARRIRDNDSAKVVGIRQAYGESCSFCNRKPPSNRLFEIALDPIADEGVRIGIDVCARRYLRSALAEVLADILKSATADADHERRLREALAKLAV